MKEHIYFRRIVKHAFKVVLNTLMVYLLVWVTTPIRNTVLAVNSNLEFVVLLFFAILAGVFFAADEAVKLINQVDARSVFFRGNTRTYL